jgi:RNA polymerase sigma-54 factor
MTPQLQHAIRLLQLSSADLLTEIQEALDSNSLLEEQQNDEFDGADQTRDITDPGENEERNTDDETDLLSEVEFDHITYPDADSQSVTDFDNEINSNWSERRVDHSPMTNANGHSDGAADFESRNSDPITLRDHLTWQMRMTPFSPQDRNIAEALIESIDEDGYLQIELADACELTPDFDTGVDEVQAVLHQIQNFDPAGVGARSLSDCLLIQLRQFDATTPALVTARTIAADHLELLARRDTHQLARQLKASQQELHDAITLIRSLNPKPGRLIDSTPPDYIVPDVVVRKHNGRWQARLNTGACPEIGINKTYQSLIRQGDQTTDNKFLQEQLQQARWFLRSLKNRNETLLRVAREIVDRQRDFFDLGEQAMKPLVLHDIAETLEMHESTISRTTTQKYMLTPRGVFELKHFFSSHVSTDDGGTCSATAIRSLIKTIIDAESPKKPISDNQITGVLKDQGIQVARRTVAKYREGMNILPSNQRKSII